MAGIETIGAMAPDRPELSMNIDGLHKYRVLRATYSFAEHGGTFGAPGVIQLGVFLPDNAVIVRSYIEVTDGFTGALAEVAFGVAVDDIAGILVNAAINAGVNLDTPGYKEGVQDGAFGNFSTKTTAQRELTMEIRTADVTAGIAILFCKYVVTA